VPSRQLVRTLGRAEQFGLGFTSLGVPGSLVIFGIYAQVALLSHRLLQLLPAISSITTRPPSYVSIRR
jgi:hypothetical protein